ncbi:unnamed protein product [Heterobilharzia americana]|nr:unnamed protein product [Heterobilharzia americana]
MDIQNAILHELDTENEFKSDRLADKLRVDHQVIVGGIKSLENYNGVIKCESIVEVILQLTEEGEEMLNNGSHEYRVYCATPESGIPQTNILKLFPSAKIGISKALSSKWITLIKNEDGIPYLHRLIPEVKDDVQQLLLEVRQSKRSLSDSEKFQLKKRKLVAELKRTSYYVRKGPSFSTNINAEETDLSSDLLSSGEWQTARFKAYNFDALGATLPSGHLHPLLLVRSDFCRILCDMGFSEMPTNNYVESSFWNFDSLFQPQQHPARDAHDTFFLSDPETTDVSKTVDASYVEKVRAVHSHGAFGSRGYQSDWLIKEAEKNLLRTHTTAVSARMLYALSKKTPFTPVRYYSIDRVFRNENLDATHLAEFHQVEGLIVDFGLSLGHLKAVIRAFFSKLGLKQLRFKPAYNPYTEPSMEIFSYHPGLKKWVEIGNSGLFRPEMLRPMGLPEGLSVIAWGLSLERPTMIRYGYKNIRDLIGPKIDLNMIYKAPLCQKCILFTSLINFSTECISRLYFRMLNVKFKMSTGLPNIPDASQINPIVVRILGQNPGVKTLQGTNSYLIGNPELSRVLVDTTIRGPGLSLYLSHLEKEFSRCSMGSPLSAIVLTHWHPDHSQAVEDVLKLLDQNSSNKIPVYKFFAGPTLKSLGYYSEQVTNLQNDDTIPVSNQSNSAYSLRVLHTPGHASDHICLWLEEDNKPVCLFSGDLILGHGSTTVENLDDYMKSLHTVKNVLSDQQRNSNRQQSIILLPGHGLHEENPLDKVNEYITNRLNRIEKTRIYFINQSTTNAWHNESDILKCVYPSIPDVLRLEALNNLRQSLFWLSSHHQPSTSSLDNLIARVTTAKSEEIFVNKSDFYQMLSKEIVDAHSIPLKPLNSCDNLLYQDWEWKCMKNSEK